MRVSLDRGSTRAQHCPLGRDSRVLRSMTCRYVSLALALAVLLLSRGAWAIELFDAAIKEELALPPGPTLCLVCHTSPRGGATATRPFVVAARKLGLQQLDVDTLKQVLRQMEATNVDSDCDGSGDIAELRRGSDPNSGETDAACADAIGPVRYGIFCTLSTLSSKRSTGSSGAAFGSAGLLVAILVARRSRRAARPLRSRS